MKKRHWCALLVLLACLPSLGVVHALDSEPDEVPEYATVITDKRTVDVAYLPELDLVCVTALGEQSSDELIEIQPWRTDAPGDAPAPEGDKDFAFRLPYRSYFKDRGESALLTISGSVSGLFSADPALRPELESVEAALAGPMAGRALLDCSLSKAGARVDLSLDGVRVRTLIFSVAGRAGDAKRSD